jgi:hypothetical protein
MSEQEQVNDEAIARRAYEISQSHEAGSDDENWRRAEAELRGGESSGPWAKTSSGDADGITESEGCAWSDETAHRRRNPLKRNRA